MPTVEQKNFSIKSNPDVWAAACIHGHYTQVRYVSIKILNQDTQNELAKIVPTLDEEHFLRLANSVLTKLSVSSKMTVFKRE